MPGQWVGALLRKKKLTVGSLAGSYTQAANGGVVSGLKGDS